MNSSDTITTICTCAFLILALGIGAFKVNGLQLKGEMDGGGVYVTVDDPSRNTFRRLELGTGGFHYNHGFYACQH